MLIKIANKELDIVVERSCLKLNIENNYATKPEICISPSIIIKGIISVPVSLPTSDTLSIPDLAIRNVKFVVLSAFPKEGKTEIEIELLNLEE